MANSRKPDNVHQLAGSYKPSRHGDPDAKVELPSKVPNPPTWMAREAKREWRRVCKVLKGQGLLTLMDRSILTQYCMLWAKLHRDKLDFSASEHAQLRFISAELGVGAIARSKIIKGAESAAAEQEKRGGWSGL